MRHAGNRGAGDIDAFDTALVEVPGHDGVAGAVIRVFADPTWAQDPTIADLQETAFEMICHHCLQPFAARKSAKTLFDFAACKKGAREASATIAVIARRVHFSPRRSGAGEGDRAAEPRYGTTAS
jgi:hypothetical protein